MAGKTKAAAQKGRAAKPASKPDRIRELERRIEELERRPPPPMQPVFVPYWPNTTPAPSWPYSPFISTPGIYPPLPPNPTITW